MNKTTLTLLIATACASFLLGQTIITKADGKNFAGVLPFMTSAGYLGLFNQNDGKVYIYDGNIKECLFEGRIDELGKAGIKITAEDKKVAQDNKSLDVSKSSNETKPPATKEEVYVTK